MVEGAGPLPRKKIIFVPKMISFGAFQSGFNRQTAENTHSRQKPRDTGFAVQLRNEAYKTSAKIIQKFTVRRRGGSHNRPRYAAGLFRKFCDDTWIET